MKTSTKGFRLPYLLTLPITLVIISLVIYPSVYVFYLSFQSSVAGVKTLSLWVEELCPDFLFLRILNFR